MDVILVLPNTTSETLGALNSMAPGGTVMLLLYNVSLTQIRRVYAKHHSNVINRFITIFYVF